MDLPQRITIPLLIIGIILFTLLGVGIGVVSGILAALLARRPPTRVLTSGLLGAAGLLIGYLIFRLNAYALPIAFGLSCLLPVFNVLLRAKPELK